MSKGDVIKVQNNFIEGLKKFDGVLTKNVLDLDGLKFIIEKYKIEQIIIRKLISYMYNYPNILIYLNKYLNYLSIAQCDLVDFIKAYRYILQCNGVLDSRCFYYMKSTTCKDTHQMNIINLLDKYFIERFNIYFNYKELLFFYNLYLNEIITKQDIYEIDLLVNNNEKTIDLGDFEPEKKKESISVNKLIKQYNDSSQGIDLINNEIYKRKLEHCQNCQFFGKELVPFDGNVININNIDVLMINLYPDLSDLKEKRTFRETSIIRKNISLFPENIKWAIVNLIPCAFKSKSEIGENTESIKEYVINNCNVVLDYIKKNLNPKLVILIGEECSSIFLPNINFADELGQLIEEKYVPVFHPSSLRNPKAQVRGKSHWENIQKIVKSLSTSMNDSEQQSNSAAEKEQSKIIEEDVILEPVDVKKYEPKKSDKKKLLLLDVKEIENGKSILIILTDEQGNKYYQKKKNIINGYVKTTSFKECDILTDSVDMEFIMNKNEKMKLIKLLREKMLRLKGT